MHVKYLFLSSHAFLLLLLKFRDCFGDSLSLTSLYQWRRLFCSSSSISRLGLLRILSNDQIFTQTISSALYIGPSGQSVRKYTVCSTLNRSRGFKVTLLNCVAVCLKWAKNGLATYVHCAGILIRLEECNADGHVSSGNNLLHLVQICWTSVQ